MHSCIDFSLHRCGGGGIQYIYIPLNVCWGCVRACGKCICERGVYDRWCVCVCVSAGGMCGENKVNVCIHLCVAVWLALIALIF